MPKDTPDREGADVRPPDAEAVPLKQNSEGDGKATPAEHAKELNAVKTVTRSARVNNEPETFELYHWQHAAAEALHGWKQHEHHEAAAIRLTRAEYEAALIAASKPVTRAVALDKVRQPMRDADGKLVLGESVNSADAAAKGIPTVTDYEPHIPALSKHKDKA